MSHNAIKHAVFGWTAALFGPFKAFPLCSAKWILPHQMLCHAVCIRMSASACGNLQDRQQGAKGLLSCWQKHTQSSRQVLYLTFAAAHTQVLDMMTTFLTIWQLRKLMPAGMQRRREFLTLSNGTMAPAANGHPGKLPPLWWSTLHGDCAF